MENWVTFLLVNVVLALLVGILGNFATGWVKTAYDKSVFSSRKKRIQSVVNEHQRIKEYKEDFLYFIVVLIRQLSYGLIALTTSLAGLLLSAIFFQSDNHSLHPFTILYFIGLLVSDFLIFQTVIVNIHRTVRFKSYSESVRKKIIKLGGNPEDLDREETEGD